MVKISHFKIAMGFFGKIWENISISLPRTIPVIRHIHELHKLTELHSSIQGDP